MHEINYGYMGKGSLQQGTNWVKATNFTSATNNNITYIKLIFYVIHLMLDKVKDHQII